ncbi:MAG: hypothetical protein FWE50_00690 [Alphaproteobacteria bacterium]|nr:hypothetical protein [Alphaproteobacteria bacterium]
MASINADNNRLSALNTCIKNKDFNCLNEKIDTVKADEYGYSKLNPLYIAVSDWPDIRVIKKLADAGYSGVDFQGKYPIYVAMDNDNMEIFDLLTERKYMKVTSPYSVAVRAKRITDAKKRDKYLKVVYDKYPELSKIAPELTKPKQPAKSKPVETKCEENDMGQLINLETQEEVVDIEECVVAQEVEFDNDDLSGLQFRIDTSSQLMDSIKSQYAGEKASAWKNAEGKFNTARLASDSIAGATLGAVGGIVSAVVTKKHQIKKGFEDLNCTLSGEKIADWGDEFQISGPNKKEDCGDARSNIFVWASKNNTGISYMDLTEDIQNPDNNACWVRIGIASEDSRIKTYDMPARYFMVGSTVTCGGWLNEKNIEKQILDAKKGARTGITVAGAVGGAAVGVGAMELFGNKAIGGKVMGQKALGEEELLRSQILAGPGGEVEWQRYESAKRVRDAACAELKEAGETSPKCD